MQVIIFYKKHKTSIFRIFFIMELTYKDLKNRDVINVADGRCLGRIANLKLRFPQGVLVGIFVPGRKSCGFRLFDRNDIFIEESKILKIGGDVILVNLKGDTPCNSPTPPKNDCRSPHRKPSCEDIICDASRIDQSDY